MKGIDAQPVGVVTIGRNEGERLKRCLRSLLEQDAGPIVYVDSGSTDGSVDFAQTAGVLVVNLDTSEPFTMARGRNAGLAYLLERHPDLRYVQFIDGDCEVERSWLTRGRRVLDENPDVGVVCGRRHERFPEASIYNQLIDMEWDHPVGETRYCGGDAMYRVEVLRRVGSFNAAMIAGEEPELCFRVRSAGWKVLRVQWEMTKHDAALSHFGQWWKRAVRGGHAWAEGMALHGRSPERYNIRQTLSALLYGLFLPLSAIVGVATLAVSDVANGSSMGLRVGAGFLVISAVYLRLTISVYRDRRGGGDSSRKARLYAAFCVMGKFAETLGILIYALNRLRGRRTKLIEYKTDDPIAQPNHAKCGIPSDRPPR